MVDVEAGSRNAISMAMEGMPAKYRKAMLVSVAARLARFRSDNDKLTDLDTTNFIRGRIAECKLMLDALSDENPVPEVFS